MPRPRSDSLDSTSETYQQVYQMVRWIVKGQSSDPEKNIWSVYDVNEHINRKLEEGYQLFNTHYLGETPEAYGMLYVLVRYV